MDDTINVKSPHGSEERSNFFKHLNCLFEQVKFTMGLDENGIILFLNVLITKRRDGSLDHKVLENPYWELS